MQEGKYIVSNQFSLQLTIKSEKSGNTSKTAIVINYDVFLFFITCPLDSVFIL